MRMPKNLVGDQGGKNVLCEKDPLVLFWHFLPVMESHLWFNASPLSMDISVTIFRRLKYKRQDPMENGTVFVDLSLKETLLSQYCLALSEPFCSSKLPTNTLRNMPNLGNLVRPHRNMIFTKASREDSKSPVTIDWKIDSSPTIILGNEEETLPSFLSGELSLKVKEDLVEIESFGGALNVHTTQKKPLKNRCACCRDQHTELHNWTFLKQATTLEQGNHEFPFSTLIPDDLPASMETPLLSVSYEFQAEVRFRLRNKPNDAARTLTFRRTLTVKRSLSIPHYPVNYTRNFPSAGIQVDSCIDSVFLPNEEKNISLTLKGLTSPTGDGRDIEAWRLMNGSWKLEEKIKTIAKPCQKHAILCETREGDLSQTKTITLGEKCLYDGWTPADANGTAQMEFSFDIKRRSNGSNPPYTYDTKSSDGTEVTHSLSLELIFVKEHFPEGKPELAIRTGVGRILRLDYRIVLVDDSITGPEFVIENLPSYNDVCPSPPRYSEEEEAAPGLENLRVVEVA